METGRTMVGRSYKNGGAWVTLILAFFFLGLGAFLLTDDTTAGCVVMGFGGLILLGSIGIFLWVKAGRVWLTLQETSFCIEDRAGLHEFRDEDVEGLGFAQETVLANGAPSGIRYRLQVWVTGLLNPYPLVHQASLNQASPVGELSVRCHDKLYQRAKTALEQSASLEGAGWRIDRQQFHIPNPIRPESYRWDEFSAVEVFDDHVCFWLKGESEPKFRFPISSKNARLLAALAQEHLPKKPEGAAPDVEGLGRILFQRSNTSWGLVALIGATAVVVGLVVAGIGEWMWGSIVTGCGVGVVLWAFSLRHTHFRCHERGVCMAKWIENREIRFDEVDIFTYGATRHYYNGAYTGTVYVFSFVPRADTGKKAIQYTTTIQGQDAEMDHLRDHIAKVVAMRMAREMAEGQTVQWTPNLRFLPDSLEFKPPGFIGRKAPITVPYSSLQSSNINEGTFHIWVKEKDKSVIQVNMAEPNFFPGYFLFLDMFTPSESDASAAPDEPATEADASATS
jgi:hypothetical protein